jgi:chromate transporter
MAAEPSQTPTTLRELASLFARLGFTAFGGPAAHVALIEDEVVTRRNWLDRQHFLDLIAAVNFIPGPNSTELAMHIGQLRAGIRGLIVAGVCFICPAMLIILPIAWAYAKWGSLPQVQPALRGIGAAIVAIVAFATFRLAHTAMKDPFTMIVTVAVTIADAFAVTYHWLQPELVALALSAVAGATWYALPRRGAGRRLFALAIPVTFWPDLLRLALVLLKIGATLFGSGYVLISYLRTDMVDHRGWLTQQQLLDAIAVGQFTPGPLLTTSTFIGYLLGDTKFGGGVPGGIIGGISATTAIFLPSFILVGIFGPILQKIRRTPWARGALDGMNAAVVGLMLVVAVQLGIGAVRDPVTRTFDVAGLTIMAFCFAALWRKISATWLIIAAALVASVWHVCFR